MIHSRPGFAPRKSEEDVAKLNDDMIPAINREARETSTPLKQTLQARADAAHKKILEQRALEDAKLAASRLAAGPELILNPAPSPPPTVLEPGK